MHGVFSRCAGRTGGAVPRIARRSNVAGALPARPAAAHRPTWRLLGGVRGPGGWLDRPPPGGGGPQVLPSHAAHLTESSNAASPGDANQSGRLIRNSPCRQGLSGRWRAARQVGWRSAAERFGRNVCCCIGAASHGMFRQWHQTPTTPGAGEPSSSTRPSPLMTAASAVAAPGRDLVPSFGCVRLACRQATHERYRDR